MGLFSTSKRKISDFVSKVAHDDLATQAAALAFYSALSFAPLVLLLLASLATIGLDLELEFASQVERFWGVGAGKIFRTVVRYAEAQPDFIPSANAIGLLTLLFSASGIFAQLRSTLNRIFKCPQKEASDSWWRDARELIVHRLISLVVVAAFIAASIASVFASTVLELLLDPELAYLGQVIHFAGTFAVFTLIFSAIFHWLPDRGISWRPSLIGGGATALLLLAGKSLISILLHQGGYTLAYGAAGSLIVLLLWVYYSSLIIFIGAEIASLAPFIFSRIQPKRGHEDTIAHSHSDTLSLNPRSTGLTPTQGPG